MIWAYIYVLFGLGGGNHLPAPVKQSWTISRFLLYKLDAIVDEGQREPEVDGLNNDDAV